MVEPSIDPPTCNDVFIRFHKDVLCNYASLYEYSRFTDVTITLDSGLSFKVHKLILASQSRFFEAMFYSCSSMRESQTDLVHLKETEDDVFALLLQIVYHGCLKNSHQIDPETLIRLYILMERYQFIDYDTCLLSEIETKLLNSDNLWTFLDIAVLYNVAAIVDLCFECLDSLGIFGNRSASHRNIKVDVQHSLNSFCNISFETLNVLLDRNITIPSESLLLSITLKWIECNGQQINEDEKYQLLKKIRLSLIPENELNCFDNFSSVFKFFDTDLTEALNLVEKHFNIVADFYMNHYNIKENKLAQNVRSSLIKNRSIVIPNYNVCRDDFGFRTYTIKNNFQLKPKQNDEAFEIEAPNEIIVSLGFPYKLNYIEMTMSFVKGDKFSYLIEYSADGANWSVLYDYRKYLCSNHQTLFFNPIVSRFFRVKGYHQSRMDIRSRRAFDKIESFLAYYQMINVDIDVKLVDNILLTSYYSCQIQHRVYCDNAFAVSGRQRHYCHKLYKSTSNFENSSKNVRPIFVLLDQPIMLNTFMFQLLNEDERSYSYLVEIFDQDELSWNVVADRSNEQCSSWQTIIFSLRPVNIIRIRGLEIYNSDSDEFSIVKFNFTKQMISF